MTPSGAGPLEEGGARLGLDGDKKGEANHGGTAVEHLGLRGEEGELLLLDSLEDWDEGGGGEHDEGEQDAWLGVSDLLEDGLPAGGLGAQSGDEPERDAKTFYLVLTLSEFIGFLHQQT